MVPQSEDHVSRKGSQTESAASVSVSVSLILSVLVSASASASASLLLGLRLSDDQNGLHVRLRRAARVGAFRRCGTETALRVRQGKLPMAKLVLQA